MEPEVLEAIDKVTEVLRNIESELTKQNGEGCRNGNKIGVEYFPDGSWIIAD